MSVTKPEKKEPPFRLPGAFALAAAGVGVLASVFLTAGESGLDAGSILARRGLRCEPGAMFEAASRGDVYALSVLVGAGLDAGSADGEGRTPLMWASAAGSLDSVRFLEGHTTEPQARDGMGRSALAHAVEYNRPDVVRFLLGRERDTGIGPDLTPELLAGAARHADGETMRALLEFGAARGLDHALAVAVAHRALPVARLLLRHGASPDAPVGGEPALLEMLDPGDREMLDLFLLFGARTDRADTKGGTALLRAVRGGDRSLAEHLLDHGADPDFPGSNPPLLAAMESGEGAILALLLERGARPGAVLPEGTTLLGRALAEEDWDAARALVAAGADLDAPCEGEATPMELAFRDRNLTLASFLLEGGALAHPTLLFQAMESGSSEIVALFLDHGAPLGARDARGDTLLGKACREGDLDMAALLVFRGANTRAPGAEGQEPLAVAIAAREPRIVELLLNSGADPNRPLREPVRQEFLDLAGNKSLDFYLTRDTRFAPLMIAAAVGESETIRLLLRHGADRYPTTKNYQRYPISFAAEARNIEAQQLLVGFDPRTAETQVRIEIDLAVQKATLFKDGEVALTSKVSTGTASHRTPTGEFVITHKHRTWTSTLYHSEMPYFMRLSCAAFGMHVGYVPNYPASHGCIRMPESGAVAFWKNAPVGTPVSIIDSSRSTATASNP